MKDPHDQKKVAKLRRIVLGSQLSAAKVVAKVVSGEHPDSSVPWKEASTQTRAALLLTQGTMAAQRAETMAEAPRAFGVVFMPPRIEGARDWEAARPMIEATVVPARKEPDAA